MIILSCNSFISYWSITGIILAYKNNVSITHFNISFSFSKFNESTRSDSILQTKKHIPSDVLFTYIYIHYFNSLSFILSNSFVNRCHQYFSRTTVNIHKSFSGSSRADQCFSGTLNCEIQAAAPCNRHVSIDFQYIVI